MRVVNISPHIGGGVGIVLADYVRGSTILGVENKLFCLDWCVQPSIDLSLDAEVIQGAFWEARSLLLAALSDCDVVFVHYWNHPLLTVFLAEFDLRNHKVVFWCHQSGLIEPNIIPNYISDIADKIMFTSRISLQSPNYECLALRSSGNLSVVTSVRDLDEFFQVGSRRVMSKVPTNLLYVGTVSKQKMHPDSARIFAELSKRGYLIQVVGGPDHEELATEVAHLGGHIQVFGLVKNVTEFYEMSDVFVYPLRKDHYGTGEQVVLEAMATGLPVVAFDNPSETEILGQFVELKLVSSKEEFLESVFHLTESADLLFGISKNTYQRSRSLFQPGNMAKRLVDELDSVLTSTVCSKRPHNFEESKLSLLDLYARASFFDESIDKNSCASPDDLLDAIFSAIKTQVVHECDVAMWQTSSNGTPSSYLKYFPDDKFLSRLKNKIESREFW